MYLKLAGCIALLFGALSSKASSAQTVQVVTPQGSLLGRATPDDGALFRGIRYAVPPVGIRRWKLAEPAPSWTNVRDAIDAGPACMQSTSPPTMKTGSGMEQSVSFSGPSPEMSEDCLTLNVFSTKASIKSGKKPVMVWIHGGGFLTGSGNEAEYDGSALAKKGVIVVTINYRLGIFGFFAHPQLSAENAAGTSGNYGLGDQIEALRWVKRNIAAFGGDPKNVTIFGESAGSWSVSLLMASPKSEALFQKAIGESGAYFYSMLALKTPSEGRPSAEAKGEAFVKSVGADGIDALRQLTAQQLLDKAPAPTVINPGELAIVDGTLITRSVRETFAKGLQRAIPSIAGFNADEGSALSDFYVVAPVPASEDAYRADVASRFGSLSGQWLRQYPANDLISAVFDAYRDSEFGWRMEEWAQAGDRAKVPTWLYFFSHNPPEGDIMRGLPIGVQKRKLGAHHASEIPYVFSTLASSGMAISNADRAMSSTISSYWVSFARTGNPNGEGLPLWKRYRNTDRHYMRFDKIATPGINLLPGSWELHSEIDRRRAYAGIPFDGFQAGLLGQTQLLRK